MRAGGSQRCNVARFYAANRYHGNSDCGDNLSDEVDMRRNASQMAWRLENGAGNTPCSALRFSFTRFGDAVDTGSDGHFGRNTACFWDAQRVRSQLNPARVNRASDIHSVVDDEPAAGNPLDLRQRFCDSRKRPASEPGAAEVQRATGAKCRHDCRRPLDEVGLLKRGVISNRVDYGESRGQGRDGRVRKADAAHN